MKEADPPLGGAIEEGGGGAPKLRGGGSIGGGANPVGAGPVDSGAAPSGAGPGVIDGNDPLRELVEKGDVPPAGVTGPGVPPGNPGVAGVKPPVGEIGRAGAGGAGRRGLVWQPPTTNPASATKPQPA